MISDCFQGAAEKYFLAIFLAITRNFELKF